MTALRILILCVSAALICASVRMLHPQIASAVALAAGIAALMLSTGDLSEFSRTLHSLEAHLNDAGLEYGWLLKICGTAVVAEFASDICRDSGETALAHRIDTGVKIAMVASALPSAAALLDSFALLLK